MQNESNLAETFSELLDQKTVFLNNVLGTKEFEILRPTPDFKSQGDTFPIHPHPKSKKAWKAYWWGIIKRFVDNDPYSILTIDADIFSQEDPGDKDYIVSRDAADNLVQGLFDLSDTTGLAILVVGCYNTSLFNQDYIVKAARSFLDAAPSKEYMLISVSDKKVMFEQNTPRKPENKFLQLITSERYRGKVYPVIVSERPEFQFFARLSGMGSDRRALVEFEPAHRIRDDKRNLVRTESEENFHLAFRSLVHYLCLLDALPNIQCKVARDLGMYKKYLPEFFQVHRSHPCYLQPPDFEKMFGR